MINICQAVTLTAGAALVLGVGSAASLPDVDYGTASWPESGRGNHRAVVRVSQQADVVVASIPWRRRDSDPEKKAIIIYDTATGERVTNTLPLKIDRYSGDIAFQPKTVPGTYQIYYMPYDLKAWTPGATTEYLPLQNTADPAWVSRNNLTADSWKNLPRAEIVRIEARTDFHRMDPTEVVAAPDEVQQVIDANSGHSYLIFPEDRKNPVRMQDDLPLMWIKSGPSNQFSGQAQPNEYYTFQLGVFACGKRIEDAEVKFSDLRSKSGAIISASAFNCFNLGGNNWLGQPFTKKFIVSKGRLGTLWIGLQVPENASGDYTGSVTITPAGEQSTTINLTLNISGPVLKDHGDSETWRHSRLRWLDSKLALDDSVLPPFTPLKVQKNRVDILGRSITFDQTGLPASIISNGREILAQPISLVAKTTSGELTWKPQNTQVTASTPARLERKSTATSNGLSLTTSSKTEYDGCITITTRLEAAKDINLDDISLKLPIRRDVAKYMMGFGKRGGYRPDHWDWKWDPDIYDNLLWLGDYNAGVQIKLTGSQDWMNLTDYKKFGIPDSWGNHGKGGATVTESGDTVLMQAYSGARTLKAGESIEFKFRLLVTPFKPIDPNHWNWRYGGLENGGNIIHVHHATPTNPYINYPFIKYGDFADLVKQVKNTPNPASTGSFGVNIYYTIRELSNHCTELWALRSLGEVFEGAEAMVYTDKGAIFNQGGGGNPWLQEHLINGYSPAWEATLSETDVDAAIATQFTSRWNNYYVEGMDWLMKNTGVDGLYLDGIGYDRETIRRIARVMQANNPNYRINFHSGNSYDYLDMKQSPMSIYMEHLPYISNLWFGEMYNYDRSPDYWLVEISGIPFGLTSEMLEYQNGGNPYRGMVYGMTGRLHPSCVSMWKFWDEFGIKNSEMIGYWDSKCPVKTDNPNVLATVYKKKDRTLIALADWTDCVRDDNAAKYPDLSLASIHLTIDWKSLGLDLNKTVLTAPEIANFQTSATFAPTAAIPIEKGKGWLLVLQ